MYKVIKILGILSVLIICPAQSNIIVEIINNSAAGVKATYQDTNLRFVEKFIESKQTTPLQNLKWDIRKNVYNPTIKVAINTYKGPINLLITTQQQPTHVPGDIRTRAQPGPFAPLHNIQEVPNLNIKAELSGGSPIANASFNFGRPWDEYKIQVIIDEKQIENSKVSISHKPLEKPEEVRVVPLARPRYEGAFDEQGGALTSDMYDIPGFVPRQ